MCPSQDEQKREKEEHDDESKNNILIKEIDSQSNFEYALKENRLVFNKMLSECKENDDLELLTLKKNISRPNHCLWC